MFGALFERTGTGQLFMDFAMSLTGLLVAAAFALIKPGLVTD